MNNYNGYLVINKKKGIGSTDYVNKVKKLLNMKKVGHSGTLDMLATGVLVVCVGRATKTIEYLQDNRKTYLANIKFGIQTDTLDAEGKIINKSDQKVKYDDFVSVTNSFIGEITQIPPMFSALRHKGKRLYDLARQGIIIDRKERQTTIYSLEIIDFDYELQTAIIETEVKAGTYIRTLVDDIGRELNNYAYMTDLERISCSGFDIEDTIVLEEYDSDTIIDKILPIDNIANTFPRLEVCFDKNKMLINGMTVSIDDDIECGKYSIFHNDSLIGIGCLFNSMKGKMLKLEKHLYVDENN